MAAVTDEKKIIFSMSKVNRTFPPGKTVLRDVSLGFYLGAKIGVLGLNGAGKSTLLRVIAGKDKEYHGDVTFSKGYTVGMFEQEPDLDPNMTVKEAISQGLAPILNLLKEFEEISMKLAEPMSDEAMEKALNRQAALQEELDVSGAWEIDAKIAQASDALNCPPDDRTIGTLSGGEKRRVALCKLLLEAPDVLLLDEPTNHLDAASVYFLQRHLRDYKGTVIAVTHDRYFLDEVCEWILELDRGHGIPWHGNYSSWLEQKQKRLAQEEKSESKRQRTMEKELEWIRESPSARRSKSKSRIARYEQMLNETQDKRDEELEIYIPPGPRLGATVIQAKGVTKAFGDKVLFENLSFSLPQGGIVGIIGPNGAGKTTLFKLIMGLEKPDGGEFVVGDTVQLGYVKQERLPPTDHRPIWEAIGDGQELVKLGTREVNTRTYAARFGFTGNDQQKSVAVLSGGERNRIQLAMCLKDAGNVLLLDEPTNDLDINTLRALEEALSNFAGCAVVISHDRWFLDRIATHILAFEGEASVVWFEGNYSDYMEDRKRRLGNKAEEFGRLKYKRLSR
jgi:energy-dependent translational throttle protein EttA